MCLCEHIPGPAHWVRVSADSPPAVPWSEPLQRIQSSQGLDPHSLEELYLIPAAKHTHTHKLSSYVYCGLWPNALQLQKIHINKKCKLCVLCVYTLALSTSVSMPWFALKIFCASCWGLEHKNSVLPNIHAHTLARTLTRSHTLTG